MARVPTDMDGPEEYGEDSRGKAARWRDEIEAAKKASVKWLKKCDEIEKEYRAERENEMDMSARFNVFWSNIETLKPAVYARPPVPVVGRRFRDQDPVGRAAALILRRNIQHAIDEGEVNDRLKQVRDDYLLYARGGLWVRYEPHFDTVDRPAGTEDEMDSEEGTPADEGLQVTDDGEQEEVTWEEVEWDFVHREDFLHGPGRTWADVCWVARAVRMTREAGRARFGAKFADVPLNWKPAGLAEKELFHRAVVWEIWDADERTAYWIAEDYDELLDERDDPLGLEGFFPCPKPLFGTLTSSSLIPIPDLVQYSDQAEQLNELTARIQGVTESIQVRGVYDARFTQLERLFDEGTENQLIAVEQFAEFASKGGFDGAIDFLPVKDFVEVLRSLIESRVMVKQDLYEITGIADILRGSTQAEETATAQRLKGRYATLRLSDRQMEMARYVRDVLRITGEVIAKHFDPKTLAQVSNFQQSDIAEIQQPAAMGHNGGPPMQGQPGMMGQPMGMDPATMLFMQAVGLLKDDKLRSFRIDIEDQSTVAVDDEMEQRQRVEFLGAVASFVEKAVAIPPALAPVLVPMLGRMLMFGVRGFRIGADMEGALEDAMAQLNQMVQQQANAPQQPSPEAIKAQAEQEKMQMAQQQTQMEMQADQQRLAFDAQQAQQDRALKAAEMQHQAEQQQAQNAQDMTQHQIAVANHQLEVERFAHERAQAAREFEVKMTELDLKSREIDAKMRQPEQAGETDA